MDSINPDHYKQHGKEVIEMMLTLLKSDKIEEDIRKAMWYENKMRDIL